MNPDVYHDEKDGDCDEEGDDDDKNDSEKGDGDDAIAWPCPEIIQLSFDSCAYYTTPSHNIHIKPSEDLQFVCYSPGPNRSSRPSPVSPPHHHRNPTSAVRKSSLPTATR